MSFHSSRAASYTGGPCSIPGQIIGFVVRRVAMVHVSLSSISVLACQPSFHQSPILICHCL